MRSAFSLVAARTIAAVITPEYVFIGDSLTRDCDLPRRQSIISVLSINLAVGGAVFRQIAGQVDEARRLHARTVLIEGGINDLLLDDAATDNIEFNFKSLLRGLGRDQIGIVTLIPYITDPSFSSRILLANSTIRRLAEDRGLRVIDLNPELSHNRIRKTEMTDDGVHFSEVACRLWFGILQKELAEIRQTSRVGK